MSGGTPAKRSRPALGTHQLLIMIDDLQWADTATLWRLRCLPAQPKAGAPFWILARSTMGTDNEVERLFAYLERAGAVRMRLAPLDYDTWAGAAACTLGAVPGHDVLALAAGAGGNPFLLTELLGGLRDEGGILVEAGRARLVSDQLPKRLREAVRRWMSDLRPRARHLLEVGAVLGRSFAVDTLAALLGETPAELLPDIEAALAAGILTVAQDSLAFRRELVWQAIAANVPAPARQALHVQAGELLLDRGGPPADTAAHLINGTGPADAHALARLDRAARTFLVSAPQAAAELALKALDLAGPADQNRFSRAVNATAALAAAGQLTQAAELAHSTLAEPVPMITAARLRCVLSSIALHRGRLGDAVAEAQRVLAERRTCRRRARRGRARAAGRPVRWHRRHPMGARACRNDPYRCRSSARSRPPSARCSRSR